MAGSAVTAQNLPKEATGANPAIFNEPADFTWYLDPVNGNDAGAGTSEQPWKTLKKAFPSAKAQYSAGKKVRMLLKPGTYRESEWLEIAKANSAGYLVMEATESQKAIVSGSDDWSKNLGPATTWTSEGGSIYSKPWNFHWGAGPYWKEEGIAALAVSQVPREEWVVYNDATIVKQVMKVEDMAASTFRVDETANKLFLWLPGNANPNNTGKVEVAVRRGGWVCRLAYISGVENLKLKGVVFQHSASSIMQTALGLGGDKNVLEEDCVFTRNGGSGLALGACQNVTVKNCKMDHNGAMGAAGLNWPPTAINSERNIVFSGCSFNSNNVRGDWANWRGWAVAGVKFCLTSVIKFEDCVFSNNLTGGLWFDISCEDVAVRGCQMNDNHWGDGLFMEISKGPFLVEKCAIERNGGGPAASSTIAGGLSSAD
jgi:hypothetical protein